MEATEASCPMAQFSDDLFPSMVLFGTTHTHNIFPDRLRWQPLLVEGNVCPL